MISYRSVSLRFSFWLLNVVPFNLYYFLIDSNFDNTTSVEILSSLFKKWMVSGVDFDADILLAPLDQIAAASASAFRF